MTKPVSINQYYFTLMLIPSFQGIRLMRLKGFDEKFKHSFALNSWMETQLVL